MSRAVADEIGRLLLEVGYERDVNVLKAKDYGSRARSLESDSSDYDVFFVFCQSYPEYVVRTEYVDTIEREYRARETDLDAEVELHGWNLRKFVGGEDFHGNSGGLLGSDAMAMEFVASNVEYHTAPTVGDAWDDLETYMAANFKPYALIGHYESLAKGNYRKYLSDHADTTIDPTNKRYMNVIQALIKRRIVRDTHELPTMDANDLIRRSAGVIPRRIYATAGRIAVRKRDGRGNDDVPDGEQEELDEWIESEIDLDIDPEDHVDRKPDPAELAYHVRQIINGAC